MIEKLDIKIQDIRLNSGAFLHSSDIFELFYVMFCDHKL